MCYVRYQGIDFRCQSSWLQTLSISIPPSKDTLLSNPESDPHNIGFGRPPTAGNSYFQLCDLIGGKMERLKKEREETCMEH